VLSGDVVSPGQAIYSMFDNKHVWVAANYEETKLRSIRPGMRAEISIDAFPGQRIFGKVESIGRSTARSSPSSRQATRPAISPR